MKEKINIKGLSKAKILVALYKNARPRGIGTLHFENRDMLESEAEELLKASSSFDYLYGRVMKVHLDEDEFDPRLYDRYNGNGEAERIIEQLRKELKC